MFRGTSRRPVASARRRLAAVAVVVAVAGLSLAVAPSASAASGNLYAYAAGGASGPATCPQTATVAQRCSLPQALALAGGGDTVLLAESGPYVGSFTIAAPDTSTAGPVTLGPASGVSRPVLDGAARGTVLTVGDGVRADVSGVSVRNGFAPDRDDAPCIQPLVALGGGIYNHGVLSLTDVIVRDNVAADPTGQNLVGIGGGIYNAGRLTVTDSTFDGNTATRSGGAISNGDDRSGCGTATAATTATVTRSSFTNNAADFGGAISSGGAGGDGTLTVTSSTFAHNGRTTAQSQVNGTAGGAIASARSGRGVLSITGSTFTDNTAVRGGAISNSEGSPTGRMVVSSSTFVSNPGTGGGDAIDQGSTSSPGIVVSSTFVNDTIVGNAALSLAASIVSRASGLTGASSGCLSPVNDAGYNVSDDASCAFSTANHSLSSSSIPAYLGRLGAHGGPTDTVSISSAVADPANDIIPAGFAPFGGAVCSGNDQRGVQRGNPCDAGAVESAITGAGLFAYPTGTGGADGSCPRTTVVAQRCTLTTALDLAEAGGTVQLAQSGDPNDASTWYVGNYVVDVPGTSAARPVTIAPASGVSDPILDGNQGSDTSCPTARCDAQILAVARDDYVDLQGFTIQHGNAGSTIFGSTLGGSAIAVNAAHVTATDLHFIANRGLAIAVSDQGGDISLLSSTMDAPTGPGASIAADNGTVILTRSTVGGRVSADDLTMTSSTATRGIEARTARITSSTVSGPSIGLSAGTATVVGSTFADNPLGAFQVGSLTLAATIVTRSPGGAPNCLQPATVDAGYNVGDDASCGLTGSGSIQSSAAIAAYLGALADNGGPTPTIPLLAVPTTAGAGPDPAARAIPPTYTAPGEAAPHCTLTDQRGVARTPNCDIGAFELGGTAPAITSADHASFPSGVSSSFTVTTTGTPTATISVSGILPAGVTFTDNGDGTGTLSGRPSGAGSYPVTLAASNGTLPDASQTFTLTVAQVPQTITVTSTPPAHPLVGDSYQINASGGGSGNALTYSVDPASRPFACTVDDSGLVVFTGAGPCVIDIDQAGNADYLPAPRVTQSMDVDLQSQAISFTSTVPSHPVVGDSYQPTATGGASGNLVTFTIDPGTDAGACSLDAGGLVHLTGAGTCVIGADQAGDQEFSAAPHVAQTLVVGRAPQTITVTSTPPAAPVVGDGYQIEATGGGSGNPITFSVDPASDPGACSVDATGEVLFTGPGECIVDLDQAGTDDYAPAHLEIRLTIGAGPSPTPDPTSTPGTGTAAGPADVQGERDDSPLPFTGTEALPLLTTGTALLAAGLVLLVAFRRSGPDHRH